MESIIATDMTGNVMAWCSLQDQNSTDWRELCRFYLCTFLQLVSSTFSCYIKELNKALSGHNVKPRDLFTNDLQIESKHKEKPELMGLAMSFSLFVILYGHKKDCAARAIRTRWWFWLSHVAIVGLVCFHRFVRNSTSVFPVGYQTYISLLIVIVISSEVDRRCICGSSPRTYNTWSPVAINQGISLLLRCDAQIRAVFHRRIVSSTSITHHHTTRPEPHTWSKINSFLSILRGRGVKHNPRCVTSRTVLTNRQRNFQRTHTEENIGGLYEDATSLRSPNCSNSNENDADVSAEIPSSSSRSSLPDTCTGSGRGDTGDDSYEDALSCFATPKANSIDEKDPEVSTYSSRSSSPDTDSPRRNTGDVGFAPKANSSDGDEADVSADTTPGSSRSSSPDKGTDARGRCADDDILADASAASLVSWLISTSDDDDNGEVPTEVAYASSTDSDLQQEDVSEYLQQTASLCSSSTFFRPIRHDGGQGCGLRTPDVTPGPSSPADDFQVCEETDENICSSRGRATEFCSPLIPCTETNSRTEDKPHSVVPGSSGDSRRSSASVVPNYGSDYASDSGSSGESIFTVTKCSMGTKRDLLPFDSRSLSALLETKCESDCTSGSSDDSIFKGNECSMGIEKGIDKLLKRRPLSTRKLIGKRPCGLESALNLEFSKRRKLNESDSGDSIL